MSQEQGEQYIPPYPRKIQMRDGTLRTVNSAEEEAGLRQEDLEQD